MKQALAPRMRIARIILGLIMLLAPVTSWAEQHLYATEQAAQAHCPKDVVVWLNTKTGVYHFKGQRWYANTREGAFVCQKEAEGRPTRNGQ